MGGVTGRAKSIFLIIIPSSFPTSALMARCLSGGDILYSANNSPSNSLSFCRAMPYVFTALIISLYDASEAAGSAMRAFCSAVCTIGSLSACWTTNSALAHK